MAELDYLNPEDEDETDQPYDSLTDRELSDPEVLNQAEDELDARDNDPVSQAPMGNTSVKSVISSRMSSRAAPIPPPDYNDDPMMQEFETGQKNLDSFREAQNTSNLINNVGLGASQAALGVQPPKINSQLYSNIQGQNAAMLKSQAGDQDRRQRIISAIELRNSRNRASDNLASYREQMLAAKNGGNKDKEDRLNGMNIARANSLMNNPVLNKEVTKLNAARGVQTLIDGIKSGHIKDSKNVAKQLTNMISVIELGTPGGQQDRQEMGVDTLYGDLKQGLGYLKGGPTSTLPNAYITQLGVEGNALGDRAAKNYHALSNSILSGADLSGGNPKANPGKIHDLAKQRRDQFLKGNGYDPESGERSPGDSNSAPPADPAGAPPPAKKPVQKFYSPSRNKTRVIYSDGSEAVVDGKQ